MADNLDIVLVNVGGTGRRVYQDLSLDFSAIEPPFWAALTAGFLRNKNYNVNLLDANAENLTYAETAQEIEKQNPRLVGIVVYGQHPSASTQLMTGVGQLCREIKSINPDRKIILTGLHPSSLPERTLREEQCDYVCEGEGFYTFQKLLESKKPSEVPGLWFRENGNILHTPRAMNVMDLTKELGNVAWDLLPLKEKKYRAHNWQCLDDFLQRPYYASLSTSLGCPFRCDFCSIFKTFGERRVRFWEPEWVVNQIENLVNNYDIKIFKLIDEMFLLNSNHYMRIAEGLINRGLGDKINIWAYARVDTTQDKYFETLRKAGFKWLCFGFESGNEAILKEAHKGNFTRQNMLDIAKKVRSFNINVLSNYMFGFPKDNEKTMQETLDLAQEQNCEFANFYCAIAWPGSKLYDESIAKGVRLPVRWQDYAQHSRDFIPLPTEYLSPEQVLAFRDKAFDLYFTNPKYLNMIENQFGLKAKEHIEEMTRLKLKRSILL